MTLNETGDITQMRLGSRVECDDSYGTVRYVGEVPPTKGIWVGVDWDEAARGKHNGSYEGVHYFATSFPNSGSFVRPSKLNFGIDCPLAIRQRYGEIEGDELAGVSKEILAVFQKNIKAPFIEVVGFDKVNKEQSQFQNIRIVDLKGLKVSSAGSPGELGSLCPQLRELGLSRNLVESWKVVADMVSQLKFLHTLNVCENKLLIPEDPKSLSQSFETIKHIIIGDMDYTWPQVLRLAEMWTNLQGLKVQFNKITFLQSPDLGVLDKLTALDLEGNKIELWEEINKLGTLPVLQSLNVTDVGISSIHFPTSGSSGKTNLFPLLQNLILVRNHIDKWQSVCELDKLGQLKQLRFEQNPVLEVENVETRRQIVIASIESVHILNGVPVSEQERRGAEYDYLKMHGKEWLEAQKGNNDHIQRFASLYPRYASLVNKYGSPDEGELRVHSTIIADNLITIEIFSPNNLGQSKFKKVLPTMIVQKLSGFAQRLFDTGSTIPRLAYISAKNPDIEVPFDNDLKSLNFYSIEDGDRVSVRW